MTQPAAAQTKTRSRFAALGAVLIASLLTPIQNACAADWSETNAQIYHGTGFRDPGNPENVSKTTVTLEHASGYAYGRNYFFVDSYWPSSGNAPRTNNFYGEYYHYLSLSKVTGKQMSFGPVKDVNVTAGVNAGAATDGAGTRVLLYGLTLDLDVPGFKFLSVDVLRYDDRSHFLGNPGNLSPTMQITPVWNVPFSLGSAQFAFTGFCDLIGSRGQGTSRQTLCQPQLRLDVGNFFGRKDAVYVGTEYQYWHNKFGMKGLNEHFANLWVGVKF